MTAALARTRPLSAHLEDISVEAGVLAVAFPLLFIHARYQPTIHAALRSTTVGIQLADFAVLGIAIAALAAGVRRGWRILAPAGVLWASVIAWFVWIAIDIGIPAGTAGYPTAKHAVTAAKFAEYAVLAPAFVLIVRRRAELRLLLTVATTWSVLASIVGLVQFCGVKIFVSGATGGRQLSFLGFDDFAALSAAALLLGVAALTFPRFGLDRRLGWIALVSGAVGVVLSASIAAIIGIAAACVALLMLLLARRRLDLRRIVPTALIVAATVVGAIGMRATDLGRFLGLKHETAAQRAGVQTYTHRTLLAWIGWKIFLDHPAGGVGWEASGDPSRFEPYIPAAKRRFPNDPPLSFPSEQHRWGVQNFYVQTLADLGIVGFLLLATVFATAAVLVLRSLARRIAFATLALAWLLVVAGLWLAQGIVAGLPLDALTWLTFGLVGACAAQTISARE